MTYNFLLYCISPFLFLISSLNMYLSVISLKHCTIFSPTGVHKRAMGVLHRRVIDLSAWLFFSASNIIRLYTPIWSFLTSLLHKPGKRRKSKTACGVKCTHGRVRGVYGGFLIVCIVFRWRCNCPAALPVAHGSCFINNPEVIKNEC